MQGTCEATAHDTIYDVAMALAAEGRYVLVIGRPGDREVRRIVEDLPSSEVVASPADARCYPHDKLGIVSASGVPPRLVDAIRLAVGVRNRRAEIRYVDTTGHLAPAWK